MYIIQSSCKAAISDIATKAEGCLQYSEFGDGVFDAIRNAATGAGIGEQVPSRAVMNMTQLNDWSVSYCEVSVITLSYNARIAILNFELKLSLSNSIVTCNHLKLILMLYSLYFLYYPIPKCEFCESIDVAFRVSILVLIIV